jgi:hypothetical protein
MAEQVVTDFIINLTQYDAGISKATEGMAGYDKAADAAIDSNKELSGTAGSASQKIKELSATADIAAKSLGARLSEKANQVSTGFGKLREAAGGTIPALKALGRELGVIASERFPRLTGAFNGLKSGLGKVGGAIKGAASGIADYSKQVAGSIPVVGNLLLALGPIGIAAGVVAAGLFKIFTNLDAGATAVDGFRRSAGIAFDQVTGASKRLFDQLTEGDSVSSKVFKTIASGIASVTIGPLVNAFNALFSSAIDAGQEVAALYDNLDEAQTKNIVKNAKLEQQVNTLTIQLKDRTKTEQERLAIADEITAKETQRAAEEQKLLRQATDAIKKEGRLQLEAKGEADDELKRRLAEAQAAEINAATASTAIIERAELRRNAIIAQGQAERDAIAAKDAAEEKKRSDAALAARAKRDAEIKKLDEARANAAQQTANLEADLAQRAELAGLEGVEKRVREVELGYEKERQAAIKLYAELEALYPEDATKREEIAQQSAKVISAIVASEVAETKVIRAAATEEEQKQAQEALQGIRELIVSREQLERESIEKRFNDAAESAKNTIKDAEELAATLLAIDKARGSALLAARQEETDKVKELALQQEEADTNVTLAKLDAAQAGAQLLAELAGENEQAAKAALAIQKAAAIAQIIVSTSAAAALIPASPAVLALGPAGPALAAALLAKLKINAGIQIATILAQAIGGSFYDGGIVGQDGGTKVHSGRDGYLARVHKGEHIMPTSLTKKYMPYLEMMRGGNFDTWLASMRNVSAYGNGERVTAPGFNDRRLVGALGGVGSVGEQRKQTELLAMLNSRMGRRRNKRYRAA